MSTESLLISSSVLRTRHSVLSFDDLSPLPALSVGLRARSADYGLRACESQQSSFPWDLFALHHAAARQWSSCRNLLYRDPKLPLRVFENREI